MACWLTKMWGSDNTRCTIYRLWPSQPLRSSPGHPPWLLLVFSGPATGLRFKCTLQVNARKYPELDHCDLLSITQNDETFISRSPGGWKFESGTTAIFWWGSFLLFVYMYLLKNCSICINEISLTNAKVTEAMDIFNENQWDSFNTVWCHNNYCRQFRRVGIHFQFKYTEILY